MTEIHASPVRRLGQGREAEVWLLSDGAVAKVMRSETYAGRAEREWTALRAVTYSDVAAPVPGGVVRMLGRPTVLMSQVPGSDLLTRLARRPWNAARAGMTLARVHAQIHQQMAPASLPLLQDEIRARIDAAPGLDPATKAWARTAAARLPSGERLCHGDLHLGNLMGDFAHPVVIDWADATCGPPEADMARTLLLTRFGALPTGAPVAARALAFALRAIIAHAYLAEYQRRMPVDHRLLRAWLPICAAARWLEAGPQEQRSLASLMSPKALGSALAGSRHERT